MAHSLVGIPDEFLHKKHFTVSIGDTDNQYTCNLEKKTDLFMPGKLVIGYGDYERFSKLLQEPRITRQDAMWQLLYAHLGMRIPSEMVIKLSGKEELSFDSVEAVVRATSEKWVQYMEAELRRFTRNNMSVFDDGKEEDRKKKREIVNNTADMFGRVRGLHSRHFVKQDDLKNISYITGNTALILSADFQETSRIVTVDESVLFKDKANNRPRKLVHVVTVNEDECRAFFADDFYTSTAGGKKKPRNQWELVNHFIRKFLDQEPAKDMYPLLLVPSRKEALFHRKRLGREGYNDVRVKKIEREPMSGSYLPHPHIRER
jgi:hypothetical protein